ncbi:hypothetical protein BDA96_08G098700, partial [Sorghum bicolor]
MTAYGLDVECPHIFDGTHFAQWRNWMTCNFKYISPQMWWMVDVGFSQVLDEENLTQAQEKCLHLDYQATNIFYSSMKDNIFGEIMDIKALPKSSHEIWSYLNEKYRAITKEDDVPKVDAREDVEHDHNMVVVEDCSLMVNSSTSSHSSMSHGDSKVSIGDVIVDCDDPNFERVCRLTKALRNEMAKTSKLKNENSFLKTICEQQKHLLYVTTCSHEELKLVHEELCVTHDNLVKHHAFLTKKISNEEIKTSESSSLGCYNQITFEHILKTQRIYGDKCGLGFKEKMTKGKRKREDKACQVLQVSHLGHLTSMCPTKQLVKQQVKPQSKPQVEQEKKPKAQVKFNHHGDLMKKKRRKQEGWKSKASNANPRCQDHEQESDRKSLCSHHVFECKNEGHFASRCPTKLEKKAQATLKKQGNEKQHMSKEEKAQSKRSCYLCRERGHMAHSCPL